MLDQKNEEVHLPNSTESLVQTEQGSELESNLPNLEQLKTADEETLRYHLTETTKKMEAESKPGGNWKRLMAFAATILMIVTLLTACNSEAKAKPGSLPSSSNSEMGSAPSSSSNPNISSSETTSATNPEIPTAESLEIDSSALSSPDQLASTWCDKLTQWFNAGATPENAEAAHKAVLSGDGTSVKAFFSNLASKYDQQFIKALVQDSTTPDMVTWIGNMERIHEGTLEDYYATYLRKETSLYKRTENLKKAINLKTTSNTATLNLTCNETDNANLNFANSPQLNTPDFTDELSFSIVDNKIKIISTTLHD